MTSMSVLFMGSRPASNVASQRWKAPCLSEPSVLIYLMASQPFDFVTFGRRFYFHQTMLSVKLVSELRLWIRSFRTGLSFPLPANYDGLNTVIAPEATPCCVRSSQLCLWVTWNFGGARARFLLQVSLPDPQMKLDIVLLAATLYNKALSSVDYLGLH